jgi:predicted nuclease with TOPRIM domain
MKNKKELIKEITEKVQKYKRGEKKLSSIEKRKTLLKEDR